MVLKKSIYSKTLDNIGKQLRFLTNIIEDIPSEILRKNMFHLFDEVKKHNLIMKDIVKTFENINNDITNSKQSQVFIEIDHVFWNYILTVLNRLIELNKGIVEETQDVNSLKIINAKLERLNNLMRQRSAVSDFEAMKGFLKACDPEYIPFRYENNPKETIDDLLNKVIFDKRQDKTYLFNMNELKQQLKKKIGKLTDTEKFDSLFKDLIASQKFIQIDDYKYILSEVLDEIKKNVLDSVPKNIEGVSFLDLYKRVSLPEELLNFVLIELENDSKVIKDETYEKGAFYYFPELY